MCIKEFFMYFKYLIKKIAIIIFQKQAVKFLDALSNIHLNKNRQQMVIYSFDNISHCINVWGYYEWQILDCFFEWIKKENPKLEKLGVLDIGVNIGNHTIFFAKRFFKVFAFEPV